MGTMLKRKLIEGIWNGTIAALPAGQKGRIAHAIGQIVDVPTVCLTPADDIGGIRLLPESIELMPDVTLGDMLAEELGVDVPYGAIVVFEDGAAAVSEVADTLRLRGLIEQALLDIVLPSQAARAKAAGRLTEGEKAASAKLRFRDHGLNDRFFARTSSGVPAEPPIEQRAAG